MIMKNIFERTTDKGRITITIAQIRNAVLFDEINDYAIITLFALCVVSVMFLVFLLKKAGGNHFYTIVNIKDETGSMFFGYISIYLISCLGLSLNNIVDVFVLLFLMLLVGYIYIANNLTYINPMLQLFGYRLFIGTVHHDSTGNEFHSVMLSPKSLNVKEGKRYQGSGKEDFIYLNNSYE